MYDNVFKIKITLLRGLLATRFKFLLRIKATESFKMAICCFTILKYVDEENKRFLKNKLVHHNRANKIQIGTE